MSVHQAILQRQANWIVSYPRSGSMFVRSLIANYFSGLDRPLTLAEVSGWTVGEHNEPFLVELTGKAPAERTLEEEWAARPAYFERLRKHAHPTMPLIKSHTPCIALNGVPAFPWAPGDRIIHIVRHPCDVAVSACHYYNISLEESVNRLLQENLYHHGAPSLGYELVGSWAQHTRSWLQPLGVPAYRIRYFDLLARPAEIMLELAPFFGAPADQERALQAAAFANFRTMKAQEQQDGLAEMSASARDGYFRAGESGQWLKTLTIEQAQRILRHDPDLIDFFGFRKVLVT